MIGLQDIIIKNNISVVELVKEMGIKPGTIWRWFNVNKVPEKYHSFLSNKFNIEKEYINKKVNDIVTYTPREKDFNSYRIEGDIVYIKLQNKKGLIKETMIDLDDLERVKALDLHWFLKYEDDNDEWYAAASKRYTDKNGKRRGTIVHLHQFIVGGCDCVDHKNHITLDNRKDNLRMVERYNNIANRKGANKNNITRARNVHLIKKYGGEQVYWVQIMRKGVRYKWEFPLSQFKEACELAEIKRKEIFGEFAGKG